MSKVVKKVTKSVKKFFNDPGRVVAAIATGGMSEAIRSGYKATTGALNQLGETLAPDVEVDSGMSETLQRQENLAQNANADLTLDNVASINPGGTARKRRRRTNSASSSLGINL